MTGWRKTIIIVGAGIIFAWLLVKSPIFPGMIDLFLTVPILSTVFAGVLYAFSFTIPTGMILLKELSLIDGIWLTAIFGGLGATIVDWAFFSAIRQRYRSENVYPRLEKSLTSLIWRRIILPLVGLLIILSPFPDELGAGLLGVSAMKPHHFLVTAWILNVAGILLLLEVIKILF